MIRCFVHRNGTTVEAEALDPAWLRPDSGVSVWVDIANSRTKLTRACCGSMFGFHELAIEDALETIHHPKVESYHGYLYLVLHGIDFSAEQQAFDTHDTDFFLGSNYLVTVHDGRRRSIRHVARAVPAQHAHHGGRSRRAAAPDRGHHGRPLPARGGGARDLLDEIESLVIGAPGGSLMGAILAIKRDIASMRRDRHPAA